MMSSELKFDIRPTSKQGTLGVEIERHGQPMTFDEVLFAWSKDDSFRELFCNRLEQVDFRACFWELPPLTIRLLDRPFECVVAEARGLAQVKADPRPFAGHFRRASAEPDGAASVITFENLGRDALLVVPLPSRGAPAVDHAHLLSFMRTAPRAQRHELLVQLSNVVRARVDDRPLWLSTSGLGVYWLHVRLDQTPKYYTYAPYRSFNEAP